MLFYYRIAAILPLSFDFMVNRLIIWLKV